MENEKEKEKEIEIEKQQQSLLMEEKEKEKEKKKKLHPSLPSNYVTLAQLQERWIKQQQEKNEEKSEVDQPLENRHVEVEVVANATNVTVSRSNIFELNRREIGVVSEERRKSVIGDGIGGNEFNQKQQEEKNEEKSKNHVAVVVDSTNVTVSRSNFFERNRRGNRDDSKRNRRAIGRNLVTGDGVGVKNEDHQRQEKRYVAVVAPTNVTVSRSNSSERNRRGKREDSAKNCRAIGVASEDRRKSETGGEIGDGNGDLDGNVEESKKKKKKKMNGHGWRRREIKRKSKMEEKKAIEESSAAENVNENAEKITMKIELKDSKTIEKVEEKIRVLSVKSGNRKQNWKIKKIENDFRESKSQSMRNNRDGCYSHRHDHGYGNGDSKAKMIWVKKE